MSIDARPRVAVDERHGRIHEQHGEGDAVGVAAPAADCEGDEADAGAEDEPAARRARGGHGIRRDEESAEQCGTAQEVERGRRVARRIDEVKDRRGNEQAREQRDRDMPADRARVELVQAAERRGGGHPRAAAAAAVAE
jgi:hypothetical protein